MKKTTVDFFGIPFEKRLCRGEFHLQNLGSDFDNKGPSYSQFNGLDIEEYVDLIAKCGLQVWYTDIPFVGSKLTLHSHDAYEKDRNVIKRIPPDFVDRFLERAHKNKIIVVQAFAFI